MMKGGESGSTSPATARITKKGAPTHSSSSSTATRRGHGDAGVRERAAAPRAWRVRSYTGKMPPPAGGSRATRSLLAVAAVLVPHDVDEQRLARVAGGRLAQRRRRARRRRRGRDARSQRVEAVRTASRSRCPAATVMTATPGATWCSRRLATNSARSASTSAAVINRYAVLARRTPPDRVGRLPALGPQAELVDLVRPGERQVLHDADEARRPLRPEVALGGEEAGERLGVEGRRRARARASPSPGRTVRGVGHGVHDDAGDAVARARGCARWARTRSSRRRRGSSRRCGPRTRRSRRRRGTRGRRSSTSRCASAPRRPRGCRSTPRTAEAALRPTISPIASPALSSRPSASNSAHRALLAGARVDDRDVAARPRGLPSEPGGVPGTGIRITAFSLEP